MHINYHADSSTPDRKRALLRSYRGIPWWGIIAIYFAVCSLGMAFSGITHDIGIIFFIFFIACSLFCVVAAEFDAVFTSIVMPVLSYTVSVPIFYLIQMAIKGHSGFKTALLTVAVPFVQSVPIMLAGFVGALVIGLIRIVFFGARQGWEQLWLVSLFNTSATVHEPLPSTSTGQVKKSSPNGRASERRRTPDQKNVHSYDPPSVTTPRSIPTRTHNTSPHDVNSSATVTTPRPRPVGQRPTTEMPRLAHPTRQTPQHSLGHYPGQSLTRQSQRRYPERRLSPEELEDLRRRRRELALRVQRSRANGRIPSQSRRMAPPGSIRYPSPYSQQVRSGKIPQISADRRRRIPQSPQPADFPRESSTRRNPYMQSPQQFDPHIRRDLPGRRNSYLPQSPDTGKGVEPRYRKRSDER